MADLIMLRLEGLLQSWGEDAKWDLRRTSSMPTKSGVVGLIACAMGLERRDKQIAELAESITIGVRADRKGVMTDDFHTVQGMPDLYNAEGKKRTSNTIVSHRQYLQDACFLVVIQTNEAGAAAIASAFESPKWPVCLGRKTCVPSRPVWDGKHSEYEDIFDAVEHYPFAERHDKTIEYEIETERTDCGTYSRFDIPLGNRDFQKRSVWHGVLKEAIGVSD